VKPSARRFAWIVPMTAMLSACSSVGQVPSPLPPSVQTPARRSVPKTPIRHVVIIIQENRSFDNVFAGFPGADAPTVGKLYGGQKVPLISIPFDTQDIDHNYFYSVQDVDAGKMDGFSHNVYAYNRSGYAAKDALSFLDRKLVAPYWSMAKQYTLADKMFPTEYGPSWTAHIDLIAGTTNVSRHEAVIDFPSASPYDCYAPAGTTTTTIDPQQQVGVGPYPCFDQFRTMADTLDAAGVSWRYYAPAIFGGTCADCGYTWSAFSSIKNVEGGPDWSNVISPPPRILTDVGKGKLAGVTWVVPDELYSDHSELTTRPWGPSWVAAVVNAIGRSKFWKSTAIVVLWDEWGGFYDNVVPPQRSFNGLGIRVPCIIISPYARRGVSHTQYEFGSVLKFAEQVFDLPALGPTADGYTDKRATSIIDSFDFQQKPIKFERIFAPFPPSMFLRLPPSEQSPDDE
jgi:phospholipase C